MLILGGSASQPLAEKVAKELGQEAGRLEIKRFPDGEKYLRIHDDVKDHDVVAIQSLYRTPDENIFELLLLIDTLRDLGALSIILNDAASSWWKLAFSSSTRPR